MPTTNHEGAILGYDPVVPFENMSPRSHDDTLAEAERLGIETDTLEATLLGGKLSNKVPEIEHGSGVQEGLGDHLGRISEKSQNRFLPDVDTEQLENVRESGECRQLVQDVLLVLL